MEKRSETNFLKVTTKVTVRLAHSVVRTKTAEMQRYWVKMLPIKKSNMLGTNGMMGSGAEDMTMFQWLRMSGASRRNPGRGRACV